MAKKGPKINTELWDHLDSIVLSEFILEVIFDLNSLLIPYSEYR
jgi:hypothetical protein